MCHLSKSPFFITGILSCLILLSLPSYISGADIIKEVNGSYYNITRAGIDGLRCEVRSSAVERVKKSLMARIPGDDKRITILKETRFYVRFGIDEEVEFTTNLSEGSGFKPFDSRLGLLIKGTEGMVIGFVDTWRSFHLDPILREGIDYSIEKRDDGYYITYRDNFAGHSLLLDTAYQIKRVETVKDDNRVVLIPSFKRTINGLLLKSYKGEVGDSIEIDVSIGYQKIKGAKIPEVVKIKQKTLGKGGENELVFYNCTTKGKGMVKNLEDRMTIPHSIGMVSTLTRAVPLS